MLEEYDSDAINLLQEIGEVKGYGNRIRELEQRVGKYQFDEASEILKEIVKDF